MIRRRGFTLFEVILALAILVLLSGAVFSLTLSVIDAASATRSGQLTSRRLDAFLRVARDAFLGLDAQGEVFLRVKNEHGSPVPELVFQKTTGAFGIPTLAGGRLVLAARPQADGTRVMALRHLPRESPGTGSHAPPWIDLLPEVERIRWKFYAQGQWTDEWEPGRGRPELVVLEFQYRALPGPPVEAVFYVPPLSNPPSAKES